MSLVPNTAVLDSATTSAVQDPVEANIIKEEPERSTVAGSSALTETENSSSVTESILDSTPSPSVTVVLSPPKTIEELIAARGLKRAARKSAIREKAQGHKRAGDILFETKNYKAAYPQYLEAIQLWGSNPLYFISLASAYRKLQWYEEAAHAATRALTLDPKSLEARYVRGVARLEQRLLKPAKIDFEAVVAHEPTHLLARAALTEVTQYIESSTQLGSHDIGVNPLDELVKDVDFSFPSYDYEAMEIAELSDSSDCNHVGNGVQCRFYNHDGCGRGTACMFSHAPDEKSVRDDLGKNVCMYFLMDMCKFGVEKCIYSHSKVALPKRGWWTNPEQVAKVKSVLEVTEKKNREQRQLENEQWKAHVKAMKAGSRPPRSAGLKGTSKKGGEKKERKEGEAPAAEGTNGEATKAEDTKEDSGDVEQSAGLGKSSSHKKKEDPKTNGPRRQASAPRKKKATPAIPAPQPASEDKAAVDGFTDYQLNAPPNDEKPEAPVSLSY